MDVDTVVEGPSRRPVAARLLVRWDAAARPTLLPGDRVRLAGTVRTPRGFANEGAMHRGSDFIAPGLAGRVIAKSTMAGAGESAEVTFTAPGPGSYPFVCTFPGHVVSGMQGTLVVQ